MLIIQSFTMQSPSAVHLTNATIPLAPIILDKYINLGGPSTKYSASLLLSSCSKLFTRLWFLRMKNREKILLVSDSSSRKFLSRMNFLSKKIWRQEHFFLDTTWDSFFRLDFIFEVLTRSMEESKSDGSDSSSLIEIGMDEFSSIRTFSLFSFKKIMRSFVLRSS